MCLQPRSLLSRESLCGPMMALFIKKEKKKEKSLCNKLIMKKYRSSRAQRAVFLNTNSCITKNTQKVEGILLWQT